MTHGACRDVQKVVNDMKDAIRAVDVLHDDFADDVASNYSDFCGEKKKSIIV